MTDIVERLHAYTSIADYPPLRKEAADEIKKVRAERDAYMDAAQETGEAWGALMTRTRKAEAERDALRIVVGDCQMMLLRLLSFVNKTENIARYDIPALLQRIDAAMAKEKV